MLAVVGLLSQQLQKHTLAACVGFVKKHVYQLVLSFLQLVGTGRLQMRQHPQCVDARRNLGRSDHGKKLAYAALVARRPNYSSLYLRQINASAKELGNVCWEIIHC